MTINNKINALDLKDDLDEFDILGSESIDDIDFDDESDSTSSYSGSGESFQIVDKTFLKSPESIIDGKKLYTATNFRQYEDFIMYNMINNPTYLKTKTISYDIETNAENPMSIKAKVIGFSNAFSNDSGIYVVRESLDYQMPEEEWSKIIDLFKLLMDNSKHVIVHNRKYENPYTANCMDYEITNEVIEDTMIKCRVIFPLEPAGLKPASARYLGYSDWDAELGMYTKAVKGLITAVTYLKNAKRLSAERQSDNRIYTEVFYTKSIDDPNEFYKLLVTDKYEMTDFAVNMMSILQIMAINNIMSKNIFGLLIDRVNQIADQGGLETSVIPYSMIPMKVISKYGAIDAVATYELNEFCDQQFITKSEEIRKILRGITKDDTYDSFDLRKGYEVVKAQFDAGINLEMSGARWDDDVANQEYNWYNETAIDSWFKLMDNKKFYDEIVLSNKSKFMKNIVTKGVEELSEGTDSDVAKLIEKVLQSKGQYEIQKSQIKFMDIIDDLGSVGKFLKVKTNKVYEQFSEEFDEVLKDEYSRMFRDLINKESFTLYTELKPYYNPSQSTESHYSMVDRVLNTDELKYAMLYSHCIRQLSLDRYWEAEGWKSQLDTPNKQYLQPTNDLFEYVQYVKDYNEDQASKGEAQLNQVEVFEKFKYLIGNINFQADQNLSKLLDRAMSYRVESLKEPVMIDMYDWFRITGANADDESTWSEEFRWLYNFRVYKKCVKMITSYIEGSVGRKSVRVVDKNTVSDLLPRRLRSYYDREDQAYDPESEELLLSMEFGICTAETGRWRSGIHTIPAGSTIKNIYRSRYKGGVISAPDYSQMEVRAIAASAKEEGMLEAFRSGADIHLRTAAAVWKKRPEDIVPAERRFSKMVTFAVLYGADDRNIADNFMNGDRTAAKELLDNFYKEYTKLKVWVDTMHALWKQTGYVALSSNRLIKIPIPERNDPKYLYKYSKGLRQAQNYPIQGLGNDVAGVALFLAIDKIKQLNYKSKGFSYVHDALYFDVHPDELFEVTEAIDEIMNQYPVDTYGLPAKADLVMGISMGQELTVSKMKKIGENSGEMVLDGYEDEFDELMENWRSVYKSVEWEELADPKNDYISRAELFVPKKAISPFYGKTRIKIKRKVMIVMK